MAITYSQQIPDLQTYYDLRKSVDWNNFCPEQSEKAISNSVYFILAKDGDLPVAMGRVVGDGMYFTIVDVVVRPEYQGQKIGSTIVNRLVELIQAEAPKGARLSIQLIAAQGKEQFYVKQGFKILPHENCGPALRKVIYT
ncbi:MAG: GNAT family N-acetyltransferase [Butyrivibrio sp.]|uniref:GNAT family N-acetyltransferase n=1 Tax=Butyrivibrio sp. TaxID=28121 RepID=UPI0025DF898C|nr:GNAT family N-acetyltransferase [Butyrivibrio sp.]MCR5772723.1 GNAT family N-acetyltransferase [Butyrivibrio sp.]